MEAYRGRYVALSHFLTHMDFYMLKMRSRQGVLGKKAKRSQAILGKKFILT